MQAKRLTVITNDNDSEYISFLLHEAGSLGEQIVSYSDIQSILNDKSRWDYAENALFTKSDEVKVIAYFDSSTTDAAINEIMSRVKSENFGELKSVSYTIDLCVTDNDEWKRGFTPIEIADIAVVPEWLDYDTDKTTVKINPGLGFGTGYHETTSMCLELIQESKPKGKDIIDFGCGSGILGIAGLLLGAKSCTFIDNDEQAIDSANENCALNGIQNPRTVLLDVNKGFHETADLVLANICADVLLNIVSTLAKVVKLNGTLILSGIIDDRANEVLQAYEKGGFKNCAKLSKGEWHAFSFVRI